jgi:uncharacterized protein
MTVGLLTMEIMVPASGSLKDKRRAVKGLKDRIRSRFNVSVAEVGETELWQRATIAVACVSNDRPHINGVLDKVVDLTRSVASVELLDYATEFI